MSTTLRTDEAVLRIEVLHGRQVSTAFGKLFEHASQLEIEFNAATAELEMWRDGNIVRKEDRTELAKLREQLLTARADAFEEAATVGMMVDDKLIQSGIDALSDVLKRKAAAIRKEMK